MRKADVIQHFGTQAAAARALGFTKSAVGQWGEVIPRGAAYIVQAVTKGKLRVDPAAYPPKRYKTDKLTA